MAIQLRSAEGSVGRIAVTLANAAPNLDGTFLIVPSRTGVIDGDLGNVAANFDGTYGLSVVRTGTIGVTLDRVTGLVLGPTSLTGQTYGTATDLTSKRSWRASDDLIDGWDWSIHPNAVPAPFSGLFQFGNYDDFPSNYRGKKLYKIDADWADIEPVRTTPPTYKMTGWTAYAVGNPNREGLHLLDGVTLTALGFDGVQIDVRGCVYASTGSANVTAPAWLKPSQVGGTNPDRYVTRTAGDLNHSSNVGGFDYYDIGNLTWAEPFRDVITAIANYVVPNTGGKTVPRCPWLVTQIVHGSSNTSGEEAGLGTPSTVHRDTCIHWAAEYGAGTANDQAFHLGWCGEDSATDAQIIAAGLGARGGIIERWLRVNYMVSPGQSKLCLFGEQYKNGPNHPTAPNANVANSTYITVNDAYPIIAENRHWADQNEEYRATAFSNVPLKQWRYATDKWRIMHRESTLKLLEMRRNVNAIETSASFKDTTNNFNQSVINDDETTFTTVSLPPIRGWQGFVDPMMINWMGVNLGKNLLGHGGADGVAKEAWVRLMQTWSKSGSTTVVYNNSEVRLHQREATGDTVLSNNVAYGWDPCTALADTGKLTVAQQSMNVARKMKDATIGIGISADNAYLPNGDHSVIVKVTFIDADSINWQLEYTGESGNLQTIGCNTTGNGVTKTQTFFLDGGAHERLRAVGGALYDLKLKGNINIPFMMVRMIKP